MMLRMVWVVVWVVLGWAEAWMVVNVNFSRVVVMRRMVVRMVYNCWSSDYGYILEVFDQRC